MRKKQGRRPTDRLRSAKASALPVAGRMCYNLAAVEQAAKRHLASGQAVRSEPKAPSAEAAAVEPAAAETAASELRGEYALRYCPVCSQRLESRRCKLVCNQCGYYMSCADYV